MRIVRPWTNRGVKRFPGAIGRRLAHVLCPIQQGAILFQLGGGDSGAVGRDDARAELECDGVRGRNIIPAHQAAMIVDDGKAVGCAKYAIAKGAPIGKGNVRVHRVSHGAEK